MANIMDHAKSGFLVIGITGPLRSGCSEASRFFSEKLTDYIKAKIKALPRFERRIKASRNSLEIKKSEVEEIGATTLLDYEELGDLHDINVEMSGITKKIRSHLEFRETLDALDNHRITSVKYISMTNVLLGLALKHINMSIIYRGQIAKFVDLVDWRQVSIKKVKRIAKKISNRELHEIDEEECEHYENYLSYLNSFSDVLKEAFDSDQLRELLQDMGDNARRCGDPLDYRLKFNKNKPETLSVLAKEANDLIKYFRNRRRTEYRLTVYQAFVIEAFRNPFEVAYFRGRYYEFYLIAISSKEQTRRKRSGWNKISDLRDHGDGTPFKQNVKDCVLKADIAVNNEGNKSAFYRKLAKYYAIISRPGCIQPTNEEVFMHLAYSMSLKSSCISRQVGAIVVGPKGYIVGAGWNDVGSGQLGCGHRRYGDIAEFEEVSALVPSGEAKGFFAFVERKGYPHGDSFCFKDMYSEYIVGKKAKKALDSDAVKVWAKKHQISGKAMSELGQVQKNSISVKRLEYCRALHAEENALLQCAIIGGSGVNGGTIYTTTFPCELCAKKIYQSGMVRVVYTEPYPKSISEDVFLKDGMRVIELSQFEGVKSHSYYRLYKAPIDRKDYQTFG